MVERALLPDVLLAGASPDATGGDAARRIALRSALRSWRAAIDPAAVALPKRVRRAPGLTRSDVAELAGLSLCWYAQFEHAASTQTCSARAVARIADALCLDEVERAWLQVLANADLFRSVGILFAAWFSSAAAVDARRGGEMLSKSDPISYVAATMRGS